MKKLTILVWWFNLFFKYASQILTDEETFKEIWCKNMFANREREGGTCFLYLDKSPSYCLLFLSYCLKYNLLYLHFVIIYLPMLFCYICSSRFTDSKKYEDDFLECFQLQERRTGEICNACVLLVKRWKKLPAGMTRDWRHVSISCNKCCLPVMLKRPLPIWELKYYITAVELYTSIWMNMMMNVNMENIVAFNISVNEYVEKTWD